MLGAPQVRVFAGTPRGSEADRAGAWDRCAAALKETADYGWEEGVQVSLQNHNHHNLTADGASVLKFVEQAAPHLSHVWDTGQYVGSPGASGEESEVATEAVYESLQQTVHLATHVRTKIYRVETGEERWLDYPRIFDILQGGRLQRLLLPRLRRGGGRGAGHRASGPVPAPFHSIDLVGYGQAADHSKHGVAYDHIVSHGDVGNLRESIRKFLDNSGHLGLYSCYISLYGDRHACRANGAHSVPAVLQR